MPVFTFIFINCFNYYIMDVLKLTNFFPVKSNPY